MSDTSIRFDRAADYYDRTRGFPPGVEREVAALITRVGGFGQSSRVLEIGVGTGRIALPLAQHVRMVVGVDLSRPMMDQLRAKQGARKVYVAQGDSARLPLAAGCLDGALGVHVFHLIAAWRGALAEIARVLRPEGVLIYAGNEDTLHEEISASLRQRGQLSIPENVGVQEQDYHTFLEREGWQPLAAEEEINWSAPFCPAEHIRHVTDRLTSATWRMTDEQIDRYAAALQEAFAERFGDLEGEYEVERCFRARAFLRPQGAAR